MDFAGFYRENNNTYTKLGNRFYKGHILAQKQEKFGYIDSLGKEVIPSIYEKIGVFENEKVYAEKGNNLYTLNKMGAVLNEKYTSSFLKSILMYLILFLGLIIILWIFKEGRV